MSKTPRELTDVDYVYVQRNFTVTDGIFIDENIIFSDVTPEWIEYCRANWDCKTSLEQLAANRFCLKVTCLLNTVRNSSTYYQRESRIPDCSSFLLLPRTFLVNLSPRNQSSDNEPLP